VQTHNWSTPSQPAPAVSQVFKRKDGLNEYGKNLLGDDDRLQALRILSRQLPQLEDDVRSFMQIPLPQGISDDDKSGV